MLTLMLFGGTLVAFIYKTNYDGLQPVMIVLSINIILFALSMGPENGLMTLRRPEVVFWGNVIGLLATLGAGCLLIASYGVMGAAVTTLIGQSAALISKGYVFLSVSDEEVVAVPDWSAKAL
jgi:O-antigen/teichoic acid export membrane protein